MNSTNFLTQRLTVSAALVITNLSKLKKSDIIFLLKAGKKILLIEVVFQNVFQVFQNFIVS